MRHGAQWARERFARSRVARLATVSSVGSPHLVPITFAVVGDTIVSAVDAKPKSTTALRRLDNIGANPFVSVLVDDYAEDWTQLWWARADGWAQVLTPGEVDGFDALVGKYEQYAAQPPAGPVITVAVDRWSGWSARDVP